jgi:hypothetical protein
MIYSDLDYVWPIDKNLYFIVVRLTFLFRVTGKSFLVSDFLAVVYFVYDHYFMRDCNSSRTMNEVKGETEILSQRIAFERMSWLSTKSGSSVVYSDRLD